MVEKNDPAVRYEPIDRDAPQEVRFRERLRQARADARAKAEKKKVKK